MLEIVSRFDLFSLLNGVYTSGRCYEPMEGVTTTAQTTTVATFINNDSGVST